MKNVINTNKIREDFPILKRKINGKPLVYLDSTATTQKPKQVIQAIVDYYENYNANVHRGVHKLSEEASIAYEKAHQDVAKFIGAEFDEISFTKNTTESLNSLANILTRDFKKGDEILISKMEHHSNIVPWQYAASQKGFVLKYVELTNEGKLNLKSLENQLTKKTKIVSLTHVSNVLGTINPIKEISKIVRANDSLFVVDGAQSVPHMRVNVKDLGCDFLAFSGHKMLGPTGIGVLYGRKDLLENLDPFLFGGGMIREVQEQKTTWDVIPWKFEAGTPNIAEAIGLSAAINYLEKIGMEKIESHEKDLISYALKKLSEIKDLKIYGPNTKSRDRVSQSKSRHETSLHTSHSRDADAIAGKSERGGLVSFNVGKIHPHDLSTILDHEGIAIRGGHHCAMLLMNMLGVTGSSRASFYIYNTREEIDLLVEGIRKAQKLFS